MSQEGKIGKVYWTETGESRWIIEDNDGNLRWMTQEEIDERAARSERYNELTEMCPRRNLSIKKYKRKMLLAVIILVAMVIVGYFLVAPTHSIVPGHLGFISFVLLCIMIALVLRYLSLVEKQPLCSPECDKSYCNTD